LKELKDDPAKRFASKKVDYSDLTVTCQIFSDGRPLGLPVQTCYKPFSKRWK
jgi:phosphatidylinositol 3-kinase